MAGPGANVSLLGRLVLQAREWSKGVQQAQTDVKSFSKSLEQNAAVARAAGAALAGFAAVGALQIRAAIRTYGEFGQAIQNVRAISGSTTEQFRALSAAALRVGAETALSANQAAQALYNMASAGFTAEESIASLDGIAALANATLSDLGQASALVAATITQFGLATEESARIADVFTNAIANSPATMERLSFAMRQAGPTAAALGLSLEQTVSALEALFQGGLQGEQAGAAIRFFLSALIRPTDQAREVIERLGLTLDQVNPQLVGIEGAMRAFAAANLTAADAVELFSTRGATAYLTLATQGADAIAAFEEQLYRQGTAAETAAIQLDTWRGSIEEFSGALESARIIAGGFITAVLRPFVDFGTRVIGVFNNLPRPVQAMATALGVAATAGAAVSGAFLLLAPNIAFAADAMAGVAVIARAIPAVLARVGTALAGQVVAFRAAAAAALTYVVQATRATLVQLRPRNLILNLTVVAQAFRGAALQARALRIAAVANTRVLPALAKAIRAVYVAASSHPIVAALTAALLGLSAIAVGVRNNVGGLGDAFQRLREAFAPAMEAFRALGDLLAGFFTGAVETAVDVIVGFAPVLTGPLVFAAKAAALGMGALATEIQNAGNAMLFLKEIVTEGPVQALRNLSTRNQETQRQFRELRNTILGFSDGATGAINEVADATGDAAGATDDWKALLTQTLNEFEGQELVDQLTLLLERFRDNEEAVMQIGTALESARSTLADMRAEAEALAGQFGDRLEAIRISLVDDDEARRIAEVRREFATLREEIQQAIDANAEFASIGGAQLAQTYQLEAERIRDIREDARQERLDAEQDAAEELNDLIAEREEAVSDLVAEGVTNRVARIRHEFVTRYTEAVRTYDRLEARAQGNADALARIAQLRTEELERIERAYVDDTLAIYDEAYDRLEDRQRGFLRASLDAAGDDRGVLRIDFQKDLQAANEFYDKLAEDARGNANLLAQIEEQRAAELTQIREGYLRDAVNLTRDTAQEIAAAERDLALRTAKSIGDTREVARLEYEQRLADATAFYDKLEKRAEGNASDLRHIARLRNQEMTVLLREYQEALADLSSEEAVAFIENVTGELTAGLDDARIATLEGVRDQLAAWREVYAGNGGVVAILDSAMADVESRIEQATGAIREQIDSLVDEGERFAASIDTDVTRANLSKLETLWFDAAQQAETATDLITALEAALVDASDEQRSQIEATLANLRTAVGRIQRQATADARDLIAEATASFREELEAARISASEAAVQQAAAEVKQALEQVVAVNERAALTARQRLNALLDQLAAGGIGDDTLAPLREQAAALDDLLARMAESRAEFAASEFQHARRVANAVLDENRAREVRLGTLRREVDLAREALDGARNREASLNDLRDATRNLTGAQIAYLAELEREIDTLNKRADAVNGVLPALAELGEVLNRPVPAGAVNAQAALVDRLFEQVAQAQEAGESFAEYREELEAATAALREYDDVVRSTGQQRFESAVDLAVRSGGVTDFVRGQLGELSSAIAEAYGVGHRRAFLTLQDALQEALQAPDEDFDVFAYIEDRLREVFGEDYELKIEEPDAAREVFEGLAEEAERGPEAIAELDDRIATLEDRATDLRETVQEAIDFDAVMDSALSGYEAIVERLEEDAPADFTAIGDSALVAFGRAFSDASDDLRDELADSLATATSEAGETAGAGLIAAFVEGIQQNRQLLLDEIDRLLGNVREYLPSSDAKRGPLSTLTSSGRAFVRTFASGATSQGDYLQKKIDGLIARAVPKPPALSVRGAYAGVTAAGLSGPVVINFDSSRQEAPGPAALSARRFLSEMEHEIAVRSALGRKV